MVLRSWVFLAAALVCGAAEARAQDVRRNDAAVSTGLFFGRPAAFPVATPSYFDRWYRTGQLGFSVGRYLTRHLKVEGELGLTGEGERYVAEFVQTGRGPVLVPSEQTIRGRSVAATLAWQFLDNQWVHPFVLAGAVVDFERTHVSTFQRSDTITNDSRVRGIVGAGAKFYMTPRAFLRSDARVGIGGASDAHVAFRVGVGFDF